MVLTYSMWGWKRIDRKGYNRRSSIRINRREYELHISSSHCYSISIGFIVLNGLFEISILVMVSIGLT